MSEIPEAEILSVHGGQVPMTLTPEELHTLRAISRETQVPPAEILRNLIVSSGGVCPQGVCIDGVVAVDPDFDVELAALLAFEDHIRGPRE